MKKWLQYLIIAGVNLLLVLGVMLIQEGFEQSGEELLKVLCNAFFVPGMCTLGIGVLIWSTNGGTFDMIAFGFVKLFDLFKIPQTHVQYLEKLANYCQSRLEMYQQQYGQQQQQLTAQQYQNFVEQLQSQHGSMENYWNSLQN